MALSFEEKRQFILDYVEKTSPYPDAQYCPRLIQRSIYTVNKQKYYKYWDSETGNITKNSAPVLSDAEQRNAIIVNANSTIKYYGYLKNTVVDADTNMLELAYVGMSTKTGKDGETRRWEFVEDQTVNEAYLNNWDYFYSRHFIFTNDNNMYDVLGRSVETNQRSGCYHKGVARRLTDMNKNQVNITPCREYCKFAKTDSVANPYARTIETLDRSYSIWLAAEHYKKSCKPPIPTKENVELDTVLGMELTSIEELSELYPPEMKVEETWDHKRVTMPKNNWAIYIEKINSDWIALRMLNIPYSYMCPPADKKIIYNEWNRVYIDKNNKVYLASRYGEKWEKGTSIIRTITHPNTVLLNPDGLKEKERISWVKDIITEMNDGGADPALLIVDILRHPILETIYKAGYHNIAKVLLNDNTIAKNIESLFGVKEKKKGKLTKILGVNKDILSWINVNLPHDETETDIRLSSYGHNYQYKNSTFSTLRNIKRIFPDTDMTKVSKEFIDIYFEGMKVCLHKSTDYLTRVLQPNSPWWSRYEVTTFTEDERRKMIHILKMAKKDALISSLIYDTLSTWKSLEGTAANKPDFSAVYTINNVVDINAIHDNFVQLYEEQRAVAAARYNEQKKKELALETERYEKSKKDRQKKYNYTEEGCDYLIKLPEELIEITNEGTKLHHCVGGYRSRHATGGTTIAFLRKKSAPDVPFFTIEITNDGHVPQIHGNNNRWLGTEKDYKLCQFVINWLKEKGLRYDKQIVLNTATGYCSNNTNLDETQLVW